MLISDVSSSIYDLRTAAPTSTVIHREVVGRTEGWGGETGALSSDIISFGLKTLTLSRDDESSWCEDGVSFIFNPLHVASLLLHFNVFIKTTEDVSQVRDTVRHCLLFSLRGCTWIKLNTDVLCALLNMLMLALPQTHDWR